MAKSMIRNLVLGVTLLGGISMLGTQGWGADPDSQMEKMKMMQQMIQQQKRYNPNMQHLREEVIKLQMMGNNPGMQNIHMGMIEQSQEDVMITRESNEIKNLLSPK